MADSSIDKLNMWRFGTAKWKPTPNVVYQAACANLASFRNRAGIQQDKANARRAGANPRHAGSVKGIAFLPAHLMHARTVADVLRAAIKGMADGQKSRNVETLAMYEYPDNLYAALEIAEAAGRSQSA